MNQKKRKAPNRCGEIIGGRYRIDHTISMGGMGCVYLATQVALGRQVAVKILMRASAKHEKEFRQRFLLEAAISARLRHPNIITVHDHGVNDSGELYMVMEYVDGEPLSQLITNSGRLPMLRTVDIALQICSALRTAHKAGVVHRDLKPGNIMISRSEDNQDFVKVLDFGLAKRFITTTDDDDEIRHITATGQWRGSVRYMSPEQISGRPVDPRSDIYSLGIVMYHMLAGHVPFNGKNVETVLRKHMHENPPSLKSAASPAAYDSEMDVIIQRCLRKKPSDRYSSAKELSEELKAVRQMTGTSQLPNSLVSNRETSILLTHPPEASSLLFSSPPVAPLSEASLAAPGPSLAQELRTTLASAVITTITVAIVVWLFLNQALVNTSPIEVHLSSAPQRAEVYLDGIAMGWTPFKQTFSAENKSNRVTYVLKKDGYLDLTLTATLSSSPISVHRVLEAASPKSTQSPNAPP
ncbi:MAG: serine/threonine protein kinase [Myxococcales bacterium]|nr:serine/threonine protein kinase [Myxococcales bacterium]